MSDYWGNLTMTDLQHMGLSIDDVKQMMNQGGGMGGAGFGSMPDYQALGILPPLDIGGQQGKWDLYNANKTARDIYAPPSGYERRQDRSFDFPNPDAFTYDAVGQSNPYLRELLNTAISSSKPGANQPFDVREFVLGKVTDPEQEGLGKEWKGKPRLDEAVKSAMKDFDTIAEQFHSDDPDWATTDKGQRQKLLRGWLKQEAEANLSRSAPSPSRNVNFSDWEMSRQQGEPFPAYSGAGFDQGPQDRTLHTDPRYWGKDRTPGMQAEMTLSDFQKAYGNQLGNLAHLHEGQRVEDPNMGGYWMIRENRPEETPLSRARRENQLMALLQESQQRRHMADTTDERSGSFGNRIRNALSYINPMHWRPPWG